MPAPERPFFSLEQLPTLPVEQADFSQKAKAFNRQQPISDWFLRICPEFRGQTDPKTSFIQSQKRVRIAWEN